MMAEISATLKNYITNVLVQQRKIIKGKYKILRGMIYIN